METIIISANWYKDLPTAHYLPINITIGVVVCGFRHAHCLHAMYALTGKRQCEVGVEISGFLTSNNRFVDRKEAYDIAKKAGQIINEYANPNMLFSEDLW